MRKPVKDLKAGDRVRTEGGYATVDSIERNHIIESTFGATYDVTMDGIMLNASGADIVEVQDAT